MATGRFGLFGVWTGGRGRDVFRVKLFEQVRRGRDREASRSYAFRSAFGLQEFRGLGA